MDRELAETTPPVDRDDLRGFSVAASKKLNDFK